MKICPQCRQSFADNDLNFCLACGTQLLRTGFDEPPPTILMDAPRPTNPKVNFPPTPGYAPIAGRENIPFSHPQPPGFHQAMQRQEQTLPTISLILGILSIGLFCCYLGIPLGLGAIITGYLGINNANSDPARNGGKGLAIGGIITGTVGLLIGLLLLVAVALG